jgi:hypothetical protein
MKTQSILSILLLVAGISSACEQLGTYPIEIPDVVTQLNVTADAADLSIIAAGNGPGFVEVSLDEQGKPSDISIEQNGNSITVVCGSRCGETITIAVPTNAEINAAVVLGDIHISDIRGGINASVKTGDIFIERVFGVIQAESETGNVIGQDVSSAYIAAATGSGDINLMLQSMPSAMDLQAGIGNVEVEIPKGAYDIATDKRASASILQGIVNDPTSSSAVHAESGVGHVRIIGQTTTR